MPKWYAWFASGLSRAKSERRVSRSSIASACVLALAACVPTGEPDPGAVYLERLGGVLDTTLRSPADPRGPPWPSRRALTLPIVALEIDAVEFVALHGCDLGALAGYRNSPLGRVQSASQRLGYEAEWLRVVERCANAPVWLLCPRCSGTPPSAARNFALRPAPLCQEMPLGSRISSSACAPTMQRFCVTRSMLMRLRSTWVVLRAKARSGRLGRVGWRSARFWIQPEKRC
jgi:Protein of unknown function (DUF3080)